MYVMVPSAESWVKAARVCRDLGQNTTGAVEGWHSSFKKRRGISKKQLLGRRPDWLCDILVGEVDDYYAHIGRTKTAGALCSVLLHPAQAVVVPHLRAAHPQHVNTV